jgi:hypothetical protein
MNGMVGSRRRVPSPYFRRLKKNEGPAYSCANELWVPEEWWKSEGVGASRQVPVMSFTCSTWNFSRRLLITVLREGCACLTADAKTCTLPDNLTPPASLGVSIHG